MPNNKRPSIILYSQEKRRRREGKCKLKSNLIYNKYTILKSYTRSLVVFLYIIIYLYRVLSYIVVEFFYDL